MKVILFCKALKRYLKFLDDVLLVLTLKQSCSHIANDFYLKDVESV